MTDDSHRTTWATLREPRSALRRLRTDDLLRHGGILAVASVVAGGLNYAFQLFVGRALGPEQYGVFGALFGVFYLANVVGLGIQFSTARFTAEFDHDGDRLAPLHAGLLARAVALGLVLGGLLALASPVLAGAFGLASIWPVLFVAATIPLLFAFRANRGSFQGIQLFGLLGTYNVSFATAKLAATVVLVALGAGLYGAFAGILLGLGAVAVATTVHVRRHVPGSGFALRPIGVDFGTVYTFLSPAVLAGFCLTVPATVDVIIVSSSASQAQAGLYVAAAVLAKVLVFLPMGVSKALFPKITSDQADGESGRTRDLLDRALVYVAAVAGSGALVFWVAPEPVLGLFFGQVYTAAAPLVRWYGLAIVPFALALVVLNFDLARDEVGFAYVFAAVTVLEIGLMWAVRDTMLHVVQVILAVNCCLLAYGIYQTDT